MKKIIIICLLSVGYFSCNAQNYVLSPLGIKFPNYTTATRPTANSLGAGTILYNSSDNTHQYSNGTSWLNLLGTTSVPSGIANQTLRNNGSGWVANGFLRNDGNSVNIGNTPSSISASLVVGENSSGGIAIYANSNDAPAIYGSSNTNNGLYAKSISGIGVFGDSNSSFGVYGLSTTSAGIYGFSYSSYGGRFYGRVMLEKGGNGDAGIDFIRSNLTYGGFVGMFGENEMMVWGYSYNGPIQRWNINTGQICYATSPTICSDIRLKKDFKNLSNSLQSITGLQGYHYYLRNEKNTNLQTGFIAQEIQKIFPELVNTDSDGYLSVDYVGLIPHLVESVKSLKSENEMLKERLLKIENFIHNSDLKLEAKR